MAANINKTVPGWREVRQLAEKLEVAEAEFSRLQAEWAALFVNRPEQEQDFVRQTLSDRILGYINEDDTQTYTANNVSQALNANPNSVGPLLSRLLAEQKIRKSGHGEYRALSRPTVWETNRLATPTDESPEALVSDRA